MEKKQKRRIDKKYYLLSAINLVTVFFLGEGQIENTLYFLGALLILVFNHTILVRLVHSVTMTAKEGSETKGQWAKILFLLISKMGLLFGLLTVFYFFKKEMIIKLFILIFLQLIIQVISIKNNYHNAQDK